MRHQRSHQTKTAEATHHKTAAASTKPPLPTRAPLHPILQLQRLIGNRAVSQLIQAKLKIGQPGDVYEQEADHIADQVMRMPEPSVQRQVEPEEEMVQREAIRTDDARANANANQVAPLEQQQESSEVPPTVHEVLHSPGQPIDPVTRAFMEPRLGQDFSRVRVHIDQAAARSAETVAAQAYTVGEHIVFGAGRYAPASRTGQRLLAHELAHVQQQAGQTLQRQPLLGEPSQTIPTELLSSANIGQMTDEELADRHDRILKVLGQLTIPTPDTDLLEREAARIGVELARRKALAAGRTFDEKFIKKMEKYFTDNAKKTPHPDPELVPRRNWPQEPPEGWQDSCIVTLNKGMKIVTDKPALSTTPATIEKTMAKIAASGHSGVAREVWFESKGGRISKTGALRPEKLQPSVWDTVMALAGGDPGWSVFTMSLLDGNHSVTLTLDANDPSAPHVYWSDQWGTKGGWKEYTRSELDAEVTRLTQAWWDKQKEGKKYTTVVRVWRVSAIAHP